MHYVLGVHETQILLPKLLRAAHIGAPVAPVVEHDDVEADYVLVEVHPFSLIIHKLVKYGVGIAEQHEVSLLIVDLKFLVWTLVVWGSARSRRVEVTLVGEVGSAGG